MLFYFWPMSFTTETIEMCHRAQNIKHTTAAWNVISHERWRKFNIIPAIVRRSLVLWNSEARISSSHYLFPVRQTRMSVQRIKKKLKRRKWAIGDDGGNNNALATDGIKSKCRGGNSWCRMGPSAAHQDSDMKQARVNARVSYRSVDIYNAR